MIRKTCLPLLLATAAQAQAISIPSGNAAIRNALAAIRADNAWTLDQQTSICQIPAPPFKEAVRAAEFKRRLEALGIANVHMDAEGNVIGERPGTGTGPTVVLSAHLDTVFPEGTDVTVKRDSTEARGTTLSGAGIGDDCRGLATVLAVVKGLRAASVRTAGMVYVVGTVGEEGPGNLRGVRALFNGELKGKIDYFISVDGTGFGATSGAVGSNRYKVSYRGPGGHSYGAFGMPNPIHAMGRLIAKMSEFTVPATPKTTFSASVVSGGTSVNSIPAIGAVEIDMRSESAASLAEIDAKFKAAVQAALTEERARWPNSKVPLTVTIDTMGLRPAGGQPDSARVVRIAVAAGKVLGFPVTPGIGSTDSNVPIALGIPAITLSAGGRGLDAHSTTETYADGPNGWLGPQYVALVVATLSGVSSSSGRPAIIP
ncbi:MAG: M20/M25/M40 family metallo-hydrolase [Gemmatimonadaceae bacterium]|nr:M20/M25/M40 family metallo-hydrolase [Gemmatimonadaceae bacterium]